MIKLETLHGDKGALQKRKRIGRGESSGQGRTAGKGNKGDQARSGTPKGKLFEGGQTVLSRRIPKRGFSNDPWRIPTRVVNLAQLEQFPEGTDVTIEAMVGAELIPASTKRLKVLAKGEVTRKLTVTAHAFSEAARAAIEKAGGTCIVPAPRKAEPKEA